jgi:hypothetical protein
MELLNSFKHGLLDALLAFGDPNTIEFSKTNLPTERGSQISRPQTYFVGKKRKTWLSQLIMMKRLSPSTLPRGCSSFDE